MPNNAFLKKLHRDVSPYVFGHEFVEHVNKGIGENCENLPARIADNLAINDMNVTFFVPKPQTDKQFQNFHFSLSLKI